MAPADGVPSTPSRWMPIAYPVACSVWLPITTVYRWKPCSFGSHPPWLMPRNMPSSFSGSTSRHQATPCSRYVGKTMSLADAARPEPI